MLIFSEFTYCKYFLQSMQLFLRHNYVRMYLEIYISDSSRVICRPFWLVISGCRNTPSYENRLHLLRGPFLLIKLKSSLMHWVLRKAPYESVTL